MKTALLMGAQDSITLKGVEGSATSLVPTGSILTVVRSGILAHSVPFALAGRPLTFNQDIKAIQVTDDRVTNDYVYWFLRSKEPEILARGVKKGATVHSLQSGFLEGLAISLLPKIEQQRIVNLLSRAESIVRMRREAEQKAKEIIPALFLDMFRGTAPEQFVRCTDVCHFITKGTTPKGLQINPAPNGNSVPFIKVLHISDDGHLEFDRQPSFISKSIHQNLLARSIVYPSDVLMNIVGPPLGRIALVPPSYSEWNINQALAIFRVRDQVLPSYLFYALRSPMVLPSIMLFPVGVRQLNISLQQCRNIRIPLPSSQLQRIFVDRANQAEECLALQSKASMCAALGFQSLLAGVFGGNR